MNAIASTKTTLPVAGFALAALLAFSAGRARADDPPKPMPAEPPTGAPPAPPPPAGRFFDTYDANQDGKVSKEEYTGDPDNFALFDTDKDGFITLAEMGMPADYVPGSFKQEHDDPPAGGGKGGGQRERRERFMKQLEMFDTNKDGKVSKEEWKGKAPFELLDRNKDGSITMEDFPGGDGKGGMPGGMMPSLEERMARFKESDKNGDGKVAADEFMGPPEAFKRLDKDGDGAITPAEVEASMKDAPPGVPGEKGDKGKTRFAKWDKNADGKLSREEFQGSDQTFKDLDKNGDGFLETSELDGFKPKQFGGKGEKGKKPGEGEKPGDGDKPGEPGMPPPPGGPMPGGEMPAPGGAGGLGALFSALDKDKDGKLSRSEFPGNDLEWKGLDKDGNGWITPDEAAGR